MSDQRSLDQFRGQVQKMRPQFEMVLASHITPQRYERVVMTAVQRDPDLLAADRRSLLMACIQCAQDGLMPDGREAALTVFKTKVKTDRGDEWIPKVAYMPMVYGIRKKVYQSGQVKSFNARVVYENDDFDFAQGTEEWIRHRPTLSDRGKLIAAYAVATFRDGATEFDVLSIDEIEKVRKVSRNADSGPWKQWYDEMAKKTAIRRLSKALPLSSEIMDIISRDDHLITLPRTQYRSERLEQPGVQEPCALPANGNTKPASLDDFAAQQPESAPANGDAEATQPASDDAPPPASEAGASGDDPDYKAGMSAGLQGKTKRSMPAEVRDDEARAESWRQGLEKGLAARGQQATESEEAEV